MLIVNDLHLGAQRKGGTTPASQAALRAYQFDSLTELLATTSETHCVVNGDLLDEFEVDTRDLVDTYKVFATWLDAEGNTLTLLGGNHDVKAAGSKVSSFAALCEFLKAAYPDSVKVVAIGETAVVEPGVLGIAHHANTDLFNAALDAALQRTSEYQTLLLHCNYSNHWAEQADHSLNLSEDMANKFKASGVTCLLGHEHNARVVGNVVALGCQFPTSVADCIESKAKFAHILQDGQLVKVQTWAADGVNGYAQVDWRDLAGHTGEQSFLRVAGEAKSSEAAEVINQIARFRQKSKAFVISNAVAIDGIVSAESLPASFEAAKAFDVVNFVHRHLDDREKATFDSLLGQQA